MTEKIIRYFGLDVHKHYVMLAAVNGSQQVVMPPRKVMLVDFADWSKKHLKSSDQGVLEATTNAWVIHDLLKPLVDRAVVTHPPHIKLIASAMVKTDKKEALTLAKLLAVNLMPEV